jgi:hypothetical protein
MLVKGGRLILGGSTLSYSERKMRPSASVLPQTGFALEVDGHLKASFETLEGATSGAQEIKRRFPMLRVKIYDAVAKVRLDLPA